MNLLLHSLLQICIAILDLVPMLILFKKFILGSGDKGFIILEFSTKSYTSLKPEIIMNQILDLEK
ncbi:MAG TPA: hypothetical protein PK079_21530 [Leptospiraceae bacterium]|nr:hypothetical protein [Leptospiraceae bacterium]HMW08400.1 hypothetical protein [Leptospiraceae bacterium]HMX33682.1 hypothetical protein [Leptospiraceae bacterium]HMY34103.1 hypothetical protein [Leptospiraceae bacterium]HMZ65967.1 hypothetical protein [Leptospiraceae bacterium]